MVGSVNTQKCLRRVLALVSENPNLTVMVGPADREYDTRHFWAVDNQGTIHDPTRSDYTRYAEGEPFDMSQFPTFVVRHDLDGPVTPSIPFAREFDAACPEGRAHFIVFYRQANASEGQPGCWIMERTKDGQTMASGTLDEMLALVGTDAYPHSRRATWAEDTLRLKSSIFSMDFKFDEALDAL